MFTNRTGTPMVHHIPGTPGLDFSTISTRLRQIRAFRGLSLRVVAGLAGISKSHLSEIERGERSLDSIKQLVALAGALQISPSDIIQLPIPAPGNGHTDTTINQIRLAFLAVTHNHPGGHITPTMELKTRVHTVLNAYLNCNQPELVAAALPQLIRDLHTTLATGNGTPELQDLTILLHTHATLGWLRMAGAPPDLRSTVVTVTKQLAADRGTPTARGLAVYAGLALLVTTGASELAWAELDSVTVPTTDQSGVQLSGTLALCRSFTAAVDSSPSDSAAALDHAEELAQYADSSNRYGLGFCPIEVAQWRLLSLIETRDYGRAVRVGDQIRWEQHPVRAKQALGLVTYCRALSKFPDRRGDAVAVLRRAEQISAHEVQRSPWARDVLAELVLTRQRDAVGRELRGLAYRSGILV
jgi:DNA-binding Xre family transcriptional regulator